jgi:hypothetical protein
MKMLSASPTDRSSEHTISKLAGIEDEWAGKLLKTLINSPTQDKKIKEFATKWLKKRGQ